MLKYVIYLLETFHFSFVGKLQNHIYLFIIMLCVVGENVSQILFTKCKEIFLFLSLHYNQWYALYIYYLYRVHINLVKQKQGPVILESRHRRIHIFLIDAFN